MKNLSLFLVVFLLIACDKEDKNSDLDTTLPACIKALTEEDNGINKVFQQMVDGEAHYWLNTGIVDIDGVEAIVDEDCAQVCVICAECLLPECFFDYEDEDWALIWEL